MFLLIDNYDSFTYNLVHAFYSLGRKPVVLKNDDPELLDLAKGKDLEMVCISPGPGRPEKAGLCPLFLKHLPPDVPVLGVCLGHQLLGLHGGAKVETGPVIMHGKQSDITHDGSGLFKNLPNSLKAGRYHSLVVKEDSSTKKVFTVTARGPEGEVMALRYNDRPWVGLQFHPESILSPEGIRLLANFPDAILENSRNKIPFRDILATLANGEDLSAEMASAGFSALMDGELPPAQAGAFLMGLRMKGESALELAHAVRATLARAVQLPGLDGNYIDVVGTGGDGRNSFNCSTASALTLAGMGHKLVKHGNRAVSSTCGSADALEALGIPLEKDPEAVSDMLKRLNFTFLFAPHFHPAFRNVGPLRKDLGVRTLFNILGPLINPSRPKYLLMGVARPELVDLVARTLKQFPLYRAAILCGAGGYDELTPIGPNEVTLLHDGNISQMIIDPANYGIDYCQPENLRVSNREEAVKVLKAILSGHGPKDMMNMVALNMALALVLLDEKLEFGQALGQARDGLLSGKGMKVVENA